MQENTNLVPAIVKTHAILNYMITYDTPVTLSEVSNELNLPKTTVFRLLASLSGLGYLEYSPGSGRYSLGPFLITLGYHAKKRIDVKQTAHQYMKELAESTRETVKLSIYRNNIIFVIDTIESPRDMRITVEAGTMFPPHIGAAGKLLLSHQDVAVITSYLSSPLKKLTEHSITDPILLGKMLDAIRDGEPALDNEEESPGIRAAASPIRDESGRVIAAVSIPFISSMYSEKEIDLLIAKLMQCTDSISQIIGYRGVK